MILLLFFIFISPPNANAQILHDTTLESIVKQTPVPKGVAEINVREEPAGLALDLEKDKLYVANLGSNTVSVINASTNTNIKDITVGKGPNHFAFFNSLLPFGPSLYVANSENASISVIDTSNNTNIKNITVGANPAALALDESGDKLYVANEGSNTVSVIDTSNNTNIKNITIGEGPYTETEPPPGPAALALYQFGAKLYVANEDSNTVSVIDTIHDNYINKITVGANPAALALDESGDKLYVANEGSNTVSVIDTSNNTNIKNITVGEGPNHFAFDSPNYYRSRDKLYVANFWTNTVSVINASTNTNIKNITVGEGPGALTFDDNKDKLYVANYYANTVSVINASTNTNIKNITVGAYPAALAFDKVRLALYVADRGSKGISLIDTVTDKVVARVAFDITPTNSGRITCDNIKIPIKQYFYLSSSTTCIAKYNKGFEFSSWVENLGHGASRVINASVSSNPTLDSFLNLLNIPITDPTATLNVTQFGNFSANFKELPPPIPPEYLLTLFGIMLGVIIPSILHWYNGRRQRRNLREYIEGLPSKYSKLDRIKLDDEITDLYTKGKINDSQHAMLRNKIAEYYDQKGGSRSPIKI